MSDQTRNALSLQDAAFPLACRLRHQVRGRRGRPSPTAGEVELENISSRPIEIEVRLHPLQYLTMEITDATGNSVPVPPYGDIFSPLESPFLFRLAPGEKYTHNVDLLSGVSEERQLPGTYTIRAVYQYKGVKAISEPLEAQIPEPVTASLSELASHTGL